VFVDELLQRREVAPADRGDRGGHRGGLLVHSGHEMLLLQFRKGKG
jgi:hypothetical protein